MHDEFRPDPVGGAVDQAASVLGFDCHSCDWTGDGIPLENIIDGATVSVCPNCGAETVENRLSTVIETVRSSYSHLRSDTERFVLYDRFLDECNLDPGHVDAGVNYLLKHNSATVLFESGRAKICIVEMPATS